MGMAASQARLLTITARLADNELRSQTINNAKMRLAAQSALASENYINALNNATMTFTNYDMEGESVSQALTYNALMAYSSYNTQYGLVNSSGQLLVSESEAAIFANCGNNLDNYLKAHGLEYKTTYFEELGGYIHNGYPVPYNNISVEDLEDYYQKYTSFENSVEIEEYEKAIDTYINAEKELNKYGSELMEIYLINDGNTPPLNYDKNSDSYSITLSGGDIKTIYNSFTNAFTGANSNYYNLENLKSKGYINEAIETKIINASGFDYSYMEIAGKQYVKVSEDAMEPTDIEINETANSKTYNYGKEGIKITVDITTNNIISHDFTDLKNSIESNNTTESSSTLTDVTSVVGTPSYEIHDVDKDKDGNITLDETEQYYCEINDKGELIRYRYIKDTETDKLKSELNNVVDNRLHAIINYTNYVNFSEDMSKDSAYNTQVLSNGKTISAIYDDYLEAEKEFLPKVFKDITQIQKDIKNNQTFTPIEGDGSEGDELTVTMENLRDIDFLLKYAKFREGTIEFAEDFNTVIKEYIMDNVIEVNGTPKYAWVDENDIYNTGNADAKAQWYTNLFHRMQQGYKQLENGLASSKEWIEYALESGIVTMEQVDKNLNWKSLDYKTCSRITEVTDDAAVAKAEAEYNRAMNDIKAKDSIYDLQLKNIDTEHTSLQTEYSVIEKVIQKNVERTFKFDQSA